MIVLFFASAALATAPSPVTAAAPPLVTRPVVPPPAPPGPVTRGMPGYAQNREYRARQLRADCISEAGINLILEHQDRTAATARATDLGQRVNVELAEAAFAEPLDLDRLERALAARTQWQADWMARTDRQAMALLRRLAPRDRALYAHRVSVLSVNPPPQRCLPTPQR